MLWKQSTKIEFIFDYLYQHYDQINSVMYKFDYYLEQIFADQITGRLSYCTCYIPNSDRGENEATTNRSQDTTFENIPFDIIILQNIFPLKIIDYHFAKSIIDRNPSDTIESRVSNLQSQSSIICFPLHPKPLDLVDELWIFNLWSTNDQYHFGDTYIET
jgi:hypothetical protein